MSYGFAQRAPKDVNEMTLVLLNDIDDSCTPHLFFVQVRTIIESQKSANFFQRQKKQPRAVCIWKKKTKKDA